MIDREEAAFFRSKILPIIRDAAEDREEPHHERNPLRPMLKMVLGYLDYLQKTIDSPWWRGSRDEIRRSV